MPFVRTEADKSVAPLLVGGYDGDAVGSIFIPFVDSRSLEAVLSIEPKWSSPSHRCALVLVGVMIPEASANGHTYAQERSCFWNHEVCVVPPTENDVIASTASTVRAYPCGNILLRIHVPRAQSGSERAHRAMTASHQRQLRPCSGQTCEHKYWVPSCLSLTYNN